MKILWSNLWTQGYLNGRIEYLCISTKYEYPLLSTAELGNNTPKNVYLLNQDGGYCAS